MKSPFHTIPILLLITFSLSTCTEREGKTKFLDDSDFKISQQLSARKILLINKIYRPVGMVNVAGGLIIYDNGLSDSLFHYINVEDNFIKSDFVYGRKGRGDKEFVFPDQKVFASWNGGYYIADHLSVRFYDPISEGIGHPSYVRKKITPKIGTYQSGVILGDTAFFGYSMGGSKKEFVLSKLGTDEVQWFGDYFEVPVAVNSPSIAIQVYPKMFTSNPANNKVAVFYYYAKRFKIFDALRNFEPKEFVFTDQAGFSITRTDNLNVDLSETNTYYFQLHSSEKYIYALYYGVIENEIGMDDSIIAKVHVFDWDGNPVANLSLEDVYSTFCVTGDSVIYAASPLDIEHIDVYKFRL